MGGICSPLALMAASSSSFFSRSLRYSRLAWISSLMPSLVRARVRARVRLLDLELDAVLG